MRLGVVIVEPSNFAAPPRNWILVAGISWPLCHEIRARELGAAIRISSRLCWALPLLPVVAQNRWAGHMRLRPCFESLPLGQGDARHVRLPARRAARRRCQAYAPVEPGTRTANGRCSRSPTTVPSRLRLILEADQAPDLPAAARLPARAPSGATIIRCNSPREG